MTRTMFAAVAAILLAAAPALADSRETGIRVSGTGQAVATPQCAHIVAGVNTTHARAQVAIKTNNESMSKVFDALKAHGIAAEDMKTVGFNVSPTYEYEKDTNKAKLTGYSVSNNVAIKVRKLENVGKLLDALITNGANQVRGVTFESNTEEATKQALERAMTNAKEKAEVLAKTAGVRLGKPISIVESVEYSRPVYQMAESARLAPGGRQVPVAAGQQTVRVNVTVVFEISDRPRFTLRDMDLAEYREWTFEIIREEREKAKCQR